MENTEIKQPSTEQLLPVTYTDVFNKRESTSFWIGKVAVPGEVIASNEYLAQRQLRANVYIEQCNYLTEEARQNDGGESDESDNNATQFVVLENGENVRAVGSLRMIENNSDDLPAQKFFAKETQNLPKNALEASRFISRHPEAIAQTMISIGLIRVAVLHALSLEADIYAVVEEPLARRFSRVGLRYDILNSGKTLPEYNHTNNMLLRFQPERIIESVKKDYEYDFLITPFFNIANLNQGTGYFNSEMHRPFNQLEN